MKDNKFNLAKGDDTLEEKPKESKFNLVKGDENPSESPKGSKFNLSKGEDTSEKTSKGGKFNLVKGGETTEETPKESKFNLSKKEESVSDKPNNVAAAEKTAAEKAVAEKKASVASGTGKPVADGKKKGKTGEGQAKKSNVEVSNTDKGTRGTTLSRSTEIDSNSNGGKSWLWVLIALLVIAAILFFALRSCNKENNSGGSTQTEQVMDTLTQSEMTEVEGTDIPTQAAETPVAENSVIETPTTEEVPAQAATPAIPAQKTQPARGANATAQSAQPSTTKSPVTHVFGQLTGDIEQDAKAVIRGEFGNGADRRAALGNRYNEIQSKVNEIIYNKRQIN